ncbi:MAG: ABC transporter permease [Chryseolinea sp.]
MLRNYILIAYRNLARNKVSMIINLSGLGIAVGCCIVAYLNWNFAATFDRMHIRGKEIYRVQATHVTSDVNERYAVVPTALGEVVRENLSDVQSVVRYTASKGDFRIQDEVFNSAIAFADKPFFDFFSFNMIDGNAAAFKGKSSIFISASLAKKYFDEVSVSGRQITQLFDGKTKEYIIGGVFEDQSLNSSFGFEAIIPWENYAETTGMTDIDQSWTDMTTLFLLIESESDVTRTSIQLALFVPTARCPRRFQIDQLLPSTIQYTGCKFPW